LQVDPSAVEAHLRITETHPGVLKAHPLAMLTRPGTIMVAQPEVTGMIVQKWRLTLEQGVWGLNSQNKDPVYILG
jgi:hypothetical protein